MGRMLDIANKEVARQCILEILEEASITGCSIQVLRQVLNKNRILKELYILLPIRELITLMVM